MEAMSTTMEATKISREDDLWKNVELGLRSKGIELGLISDEEVRRLMRIELEQRIKWGTKPTQQEQLAQQLDFIKTLRGMKISTETDRAHNSKFYDTPRSFDLIVAGNTLKESTGLYTDATTTVDEASTKMMDLYCERANIEDGHTILDLGCGCGPLVLHIAKKYKNCKITGVTDELSQKQYILEHCKNLNLSNVEIVIGDVTSLDMESTFDRVFGIEVIEHLKNFGLFLREISKWMKDDGFLFLEHLCHKSFSYHAEEPLSEDDWYHKYFLPTGTLASAACLLYFQEDVTVMDHWLVSGNHYARTAEECWKAIDGNIEEIKDIFISFYGIGEEDAVKRIKWWRIVFIINEEMFKYNNGEEWMVSHLLFKKK